MGRKNKAQQHYNMVRAVVLKPRSRTQTLLLKSMRENDVTFAIGSAGTGKTYCAVSYALKELLAGQIEKIFIVRPVVEAGENLGFLPGSIREKMDPYLQPIYDVISDQLGPLAKNQLLGEGKLEICPLAYMRGRTLKSAMVILDEAQNANVDQLEMFLTRIGDGTKYVICGDPTQHDIRHKIGLPCVANAMKDIPGIGTVLFENSDVVRHPLIEKMLDKFAELKDAQKKEKRQVPTTGKAVQIGSVPDGTAIDWLEEAPDLVDA